MSHEIAIEIEGLSKCYSIFEKPSDRLFVRWFPAKKKVFWALRNISFSINKGETVAIIGRNGSGKSTLLQLICGTLHPTSGNAVVKGRVAALLELGAGFDPESSGRDNVYINGMLLGMNEAEIRQKFDDIAAFADIGDFIDQPVKTYSSGMFVRLAFSVIAHSDPDVLIIDEALAVGDVFFVQKCMRFIREFKTKGTILFVSHDTNAVINLCDKAVWIHDGELKLIGPAKEISERYMAFQHAKDRRLETSEEVHIAEASLKVEYEADDVQDFRSDLINSSSLRNDLHVVALDIDSNDFGTKKANIVDVTLTQSGTVVRSIVGGELVRLEIKVHILDDLDSVIAGFHLKDRLGQKLFGDNTFLHYQTTPKNFKKGEKLIAKFEFRMPLLPAGDYSFDVAFATGNQDNHTQHHWIHDALIFKSIRSSVATGIIGIPMKNIEIVKV